MNVLSLLLVSLPVLALTWTYGGMRAPELARLAPWAMLAGLVGVFVLPQRHKGESWRDAEVRVLKAVFKDAFFWTALALVVYLLIPLFNVSLCPTCDWQQIDAGANPFPPYRFLPFCARPAEHADLIWWFAPTLVAALGVRHGLTRSGKRAFFEAIAWNGALLSALGFVQLMTGAKSPYWGEVARAVHFFSVFGYPNAAGSFFAFMTAVSLGVWCQSMARSEQWAMDTTPRRHVFLATHYPFLAFALNACGAFASLSRAAMSFALVLVVLFLAYVLARVVASESWQRQTSFRNLVAAYAVLLALAAAVFVYAPPEVGRELRSLNSRAMADRVSGKAQYHTRVATDIMREFPIYGVGGWGYKHFCLSYMTDKEIKTMQKTGGVNVHNDYLQYLAELGLAGTGLLVACLVMLIRPWWSTWRQLSAEAFKSARAGMIMPSLPIFVVEPPVFWTLLAVVVVLVHAFGDCPLRVPAILVALFTVFPAACGFLPHQKKKKQNA